MDLARSSHLPQDVLNLLSPVNRSCISRLTANLSTEPPEVSVCLPQSRLAAVLVLLYEEAGLLRVLLTTRSKSLRTHAGQTALPGGKMDVNDGSLIATAFREAHEEVSLPLNCPDIHTIGYLEPFMSLHKLIVTPVVALLTRLDVLEVLTASEDEVSNIFSHPLQAILDPSLVKLTETLVPVGEDWPYETEYYHTTDSVMSILGNTEYRMHRFRTAASPVKGLTADILIKTAEIAYGQPTKYERYAKNQLRGLAAIMKVMDSE